MTMHHATLDTLQSALAQLRSGQLDPHGFSRQARAHTALLQALPPRYAQVLADLLTRLESSALFSEESCSFSQGDLIGALRDWLTRAQAL